MRIRSKNPWNTQFYLFDLRVNTMLIRPGLCWSIEEVTSNIAPTFRDTHCGLACDLCDRLLGTRYYFSPGGGGGRLGGNTWFLAEQNGGSVESHGNQTRLCWSSGEVTSNIAPVFGDFNCGLIYDGYDRLLWGPVIVYRLGVAGVGFYGGSPDF